MSKQSMSCLFYTKFRFQRELRAISIFNYSNNKKKLLKNPKASSLISLNIHHKKHTNKETTIQIAYLHASICKS
ncbi:hypothetical protein QVD17_18054 [Tagetes erecta]|uniref:Uncharacterized protein n=1 Tax=Tagetes erecta TaxID=13708 RepID=A0AAD8KJS0_TARER|nr:hypothetical protein QVD17_18054 [Tagetes erecta]